MQAALNSWYGLAGAVIAAFFGGGGLATTVIKARADHSAQTDQLESALIDKLQTQIANQQTQIQALWAENRLLREELEKVRVQLAAVACVVKRDHRKDGS